VGGGLLLLTVSEGGLLADVAPPVVVGEAVGGEEERGGQHARGGALRVHVCLWECRSISIDSYCRQQMLNGAMDGPDLVQGCSRRCPLLSGII